MRIRELTPEQAENTVVFSGSVHPDLTQSTVNALGIEAGKVRLKRFPNSEPYARPEESVRGKDVFIIQPHVEANGFTTSDAIQEHLILIDAVVRASAGSVTAIMPMYGFSRQDRKAKGREPITARLLADQFEIAGADRLMSVDLHAPQIQGFFKVFDHLTAMRLLRKKVKKMIPSDRREEWAMVAPDQGRLKVAQKWGDELGIDVVSIAKAHDKDDSSKVATIGRSDFPEVDGRSCVLLDDMIDTAGTLRNATDALDRSGAERIIAVTTHPILSDPALERLQDSPISKLIVSNTVPTDRAKEALGDRLKVIDIGPMLAKSIMQIVGKGSISDIFDDENHS